MLIYLFPRIMMVGDNDINSRQNKCQSDYRLQAEMLIEEQSSENHSSQRLQRPEYGSNCRPDPSYCLDTGEV